MFQFKDFDYLTNGEIDLLIDEKTLADPIRGFVPSYRYRITLHNSNVTIGNIDIRIGNNEGTYYGGHIGYRIHEAYRGNAYATMACRLIAQVAIAHGMEYLYITCNPNNYPSRKTCEKLSLTLLEIVDLPPNNEMYQLGERQKCRYGWDLLS